MEEERDKKWTYYTIDRERYDRYLGTLVGMAGKNYKEFELEDLEKRLHEVKETDICEIRNKMK